MDWINNFVIPLMKAIVLLGVTGGFIFLILRGIIVRYRRSGKFFVKYSLFRRKIKDEYVNWITNAIQMGMTKEQCQMYLYMKGIDKDLVNEISWLYIKFRKTMKGGFNKNVGKFEESYREVESPKLPNIKEGR